MPLIADRDICSELAFVDHVIRNAPQLMWFLGAGASRSAGMPSATDIIWDLKRKYYCLQENQDVQLHDISNKAVKRKIQRYLDAQGLPPLGAADEYSFYFELMFGSDSDAQRSYVAGQLSSDKISLNVGQRALAALLEMGLSKIVFTTNFDQIVETAYSEVAQKHLSSFHLEGAYAALDALNAEQFPIYAKVHGDFRYLHIKNLAPDLLENDERIQSCFLAASARYGMIVSGYSGRDSNVMEMFRSALKQNNSFPTGLFWTTPRLSEVSDGVIELMEFARKNGTRARVVQVGTFDTLLLKIWRHLAEKPVVLDQKVRTAAARPVSIQLPPPGKRYPILRTNALPVIAWPRQCGTIGWDEPTTFKELRDGIRKHRPDAATCHVDKVLFFGASKEVGAVFEKRKVGSVEACGFDEDGTAVGQSTILRSFLTETLAKGLCHERPLCLRKKGRAYYAVVDPADVDDPSLRPLKDAVGYKGKVRRISGSVPGMDATFWTEALSVKLEERGGVLWLMIQPDIWVTPLSKRERATDFLREKKIRRYNSQSSALLNAWVQVIFGTVGSGEEVTVTCFPNTDYPAVFTINTRTAFSSCIGTNDQ